MRFAPIHPDATLEHFGYIPSFLSDDDPRPAKEQFNDRYVSGWRPLPGVEILSGLRLKYPGDPPLRPLAALLLRDEAIMLYEHDMVAIIQPDGSFEVCRMD